MFAPTGWDIEAGAYPPISRKGKRYIPWWSKALPHSIPVIVLLIIFILWWLSSYPVDLVKKDGVTEPIIIRADRQLLHEETNHVYDLASASPPVTPILEELTMDTEGKLVDDDAFLPQKTKAEE